MNSSSGQVHRILIICPFPVGVAAGQRLKYEQYFDDWRAKGLEIDVSSFMDTAIWEVVYEPGHLLAKALGVLCGHIRRVRDMFRVRNYDLIYVFMWVTPFGTSMFERLTRLLAKSLVFDVEDNVLIEQTLPKEYNPNTIIRLLKGRGKARYLIRKANHVITSSPFLNEFCLKLNESRCCTYISSSVDTERFIPDNSYSNDKLVTIGWTGTFSSKIYLDLLRNVFKELAQRVPFKLRIIGNFDYELAGIELEVIRWTSKNEVEDLQGIDIGIYPLPINDWVLGKSGLKAIQYMAFGLPVVATDVGTTPLLISDNFNGILVKTELEWVDALERLVKGSSLRQQLGKAARISAIENYSTKAIAAYYWNILSNLLEQKNG